jgi:cytochrome c oxidase cbb3-type subunit III
MRDKVDTRTIRACRSFAASVITCAAALLLAAGGPSQETKVAKVGGAARRADGQVSLADGRQVFESRCAACHGLDGRGGERAPDIATRATLQRRSDAELAHIVQAGIPAGGMPGFATLDEGTLKAVVAYLRLLQGKASDAKLPGAPGNGKVIFFGKGRCAECHMVGGSGGFIASDLTAYGRTRSAEEIREAIVKPDGKGRQGAAVVTTKDGRKYSGVVRNEDNFSLQLQSLDGAFHLFEKSEVESLARQTEPMMPTDYGSTLSASELNDLLSFLMASGKNGKEAPDPKRNFSRR